MRDEGFGLAVVDDVGNLGTDEVVVDRCEVEADLSRPEDRAVLDRLGSWEAGLALDAGRDETRSIEPCPDILVRTSDKRPVTDDNMGTEWRHFLRLD